MAPTGTATISENGIFAFTLTAKFTLQSPLSLATEIMIAAPVPGCQDDEVGEAQPRASRRRNHERVLGRDVRPARRKRRQVPVVVAVEDALLTPEVPPLHKIELLPELGMKRVRDPDRRGHLAGVAGS